jgi:putative molybdopterin biosynthesis protein
VLSGKADAGLGLRATAESLGLGFVPLGHETVRVLANEARSEKPGVRALADVIESGEDVFDSLAGYEREG